ncbi:hypothetical protein OPQ81_005713 [Rhizoctonia solani]|nr:hypothetical protein OPQ81_005713 [Rhizoctonia solani]
MADSSFGPEGNTAETNTALWGSDDDVGQEEGLWIWRIEDFKIVPWLDDRKGQFYGGDSYITLHTYKNPDTEVLVHDLHFWLGSQTSLDEAGTTAYKGVELDDLVLDYGQLDNWEVRLPVDYLEEGDVYVFEPGGEANTAPAIMQYSSKGSTGKVRLKATEIVKEPAGDLGEVQVYAPSRGHADATEPVSLCVVPSASPPYIPLPAAILEALNPSDILMLAGPKGIYIWTGS